MPKQKSHSGSKKRFWLTATGKVKGPTAARTTKPKQRTEREREICVRTLSFPQLRNLPLRV